MLHQTWTKWHMHSISCFVARSIHFHFDFRLPATAELQRKLKLSQFCKTGRPFTKLASSALISWNIESKTAERACLVNIKKGTVVTLKRDWLKVILVNCEMRNQYELFSLDLFIVENFSGSSNISKAVVAAAAPGFSLLAPACLQFPQLWLNWRVMY